MSEEREPKPCYFCGEKKGSYGELCDDCRNKLQQLKQSIEAAKGGRDEQS